MKIAEPLVRAPEFLTNLFSLNDPSEAITNQMEMKKRISLELRNRTPAEVSALIIYFVHRNAK